MREKANVRQEARVYTRDELLSSWRSQQSSRDWAIVVNENPERQTYNTHFETYTDEKNLPGGTSEFPRVRAYLGLALGPACMLFNNLRELIEETPYPNTDFRKLDKLVVRPEVLEREKVN